jgi:hypothetical protein
MLEFFNGKLQTNLEKRFPENKYIYFEVPYMTLSVGKKKRVAYVPEPEELVRLKKEDQFTFKSGRNEIEVKKSEVKTVVVIFRKINWSIDNDIKRMSRIYDEKLLKYRVDFNVYCENILKKLFIMIIDLETGEEKYIDSDSIKKLDNNFAEGILRYFFKYQPHQFSMEEEEEAKLIRDIHKYFSYWKYNDHTEQPPPCPSIIIESSIASRFPGWTLDYIRSLDYADIVSLNALSRQKEINEFEGSERARKAQVNIDGKMVSAVSMEEAERMILENEKKKKIVNGKKDVVEEKKEVVSDPNKFLEILINDPDTMTKRFFESAQKNIKIKKK